MGIPSLCIQWYNGDTNRFEASEEYQTIQHAELIIMEEGQADEPPMGQPSADEIPAPPACAGLTGDLSKDSPMLWRDPS